MLDEQMLAWLLVYMQEREPLVQGFAVYGLLFCFYTVWAFLGGRITIIFLTLCFVPSCQVDL